MAAVQAVHIDSTSPEILEKLDLYLFGALRYIALHELIYVLCIMSVNQEVNQEQIVTITIYYTEPGNAITIPAHTSLTETHEAIRSAIRATQIEDGLILEPSSPDLSSIIIASGESFFNISHFP